MKQLSIIIPVYNVEAYLSECLDSVYDGSADESTFEVIVVNDGSTDGSAAIVEDYRRRHDNMLVITQENQGLSATRMNGLAQAQGEYVWFVDSDDYLAEQAVGDILELIRTPDIPTVIMTPIRRPDPKTGALFLDYEIDAPRLMEGMDVFLDNRFPKWSASRYILRRNLFDDPRLFFPKGLLHEDEYFGAVLQMLAGKVLVHDKVFFIHRIRPESIMQTISIRSSYDYVSNYALLKAFSETLPASQKDMCLRQVQRLLPYSYTVNERIWRTPAFRRFKRRKGPYIVFELLRSGRLHTFRELAALLFYIVAPSAFRKRFPNIPRQ